MCSPTPAGGAVARWPEGRDELITRTDRVLPRCAHRAWPAAPPGDRGGPTDSATACLRGGRRAVMGCAVGRPGHGGRCRAVGAGPGWAGWAHRVDVVASLCSNGAPFL